jgi:hypothetical protein
MKGFEPLRANPTDIVKQKLFKSVALTTFGKLERVLLDRVLAKITSATLSILNPGRKLHYLACKIQVFGLSLGE